MKKILDSIKTPLIIFCLGIVLHQPIEILLTKLIVDPFLSKIEFKGELFTSLAFLLLSFIFMIGLINKLTKNYQFSTSWITWTILLAAAYVYYRNEGHIWIFHELSSLNDWSFKGADVFFLFPLFFTTALIISKIKRVQKEEQSSQSIGFLLDEPKSIDNEYDPHERLRFVKIMTEKIKSTPSGESSFVIGIIGKWGSGKTSFIKTLQKNFTSDTGIISIQFNPWIMPGSGNITESFFSEFSNKLSNYIDSIHSDISAYVRVIMQDKKKTLPFAAAEYVMPSVNWNKSGIDHLKEKINTSLQALGQKVIVYMDDLDRLDKTEIMEALRLIRNSADFANVFFIVAYDKIQVLNAIKEHFELGHDRYLEKIFQVEFYLTPLKRNAILTEGIKGLENMLDKSDNKVLNDMFSYQTGLFDESYEWIQEYFDHHRDIVRFLNQFSLHYEFVKKEVFLPDFVVMMILRLKYPEVYNFLFQNQRIYLSTEDLKRTNNKETILILKYASDPKTRDNTLLFNDMKTRSAELGLQSGDERAFNLINRIFGVSEIGLIGRFAYRTDLPKSHLRVIIPRFFSRYFDYSLAGKLSDVEFDEAIRNLSKDNFLIQFSEWLKDVDQGGEAISSLERIVDYEDSKEIFDKVISALIVAGNSAIPNKSGNYYINEEAFLNRFYYKNSKSNPLYHIFENQDELTNYLRDVLHENLGINSWLYDVIRRQTKESIYSIALPMDEIKKHITTAVDSYFSQSPKINRNLLNKLSDRIKLTSESEMSAFKEKVREYFLNNLTDALPMFIGPCQEHFDDGNFRIYSDRVGVFFDSDQSFISSVKSYNLDYGKELEDFATAIKNETKYQDCTKFEFRNLPIEPIIED